MNGRSFTDLLAIQPGVIPITTLLPNSVIMAGVTGGLSPSGDLNPGNLSIDGQRESSNGFLVNGIDVQEHMNGGTSIVANLDSIDEFRVLTNNFDPEYGNYNGGMVTVITKSGSDSFHGNAFEFLAQHGLWMRAATSIPAARAFRQNQFGGTLGGPDRASKSLFLRGLSRHADKRRRGNGTDLGSFRSGSLGNLSDLASSLTGNVSGSYLASLLSRSWVMPVSAGEPLLVRCLLRGGVIFRMKCLVGAGPRSAAIHSLAQHRRRSIFHFGLSADGARRQGFRPNRRQHADWGQLSAYYFFDDYRLDNPYPGQQGGASIPGFDALTFGRAQLASLGDTKAFGTGTVNEFHAGFLR